MPHTGVSTFGVSLRLLCERSSVEVPLILGDILRWLAAHALAQPDVFAQQPRSAGTSHLKSAIDSGIALSELVDGKHPAVVGSLLKRWLEELPDPLLDWDQQVALLSACKDEGCIEARIARLNDAVALVNHVSLGTLKPLLLFLQQYCFRQRRFDQQLLQVAVAFAPILFPAALAAGPAELRLAEETVATLVSNALHVFNPTLAASVPVVTPQALCEAAAEAMESAQQEEQQQRHTSKSPRLAGAVNDGGKASPAASPAGGHARLQPCYETLVDDVALLSIDQHLPQRRSAQEKEEMHPVQSGCNSEHASPERSCFLAVQPEEQGAGALDSVKQTSLDDVLVPCEPYLSDATFLASFEAMVCDCVASALFCSTLDTAIPALGGSGGGATIDCDDDDHCGSLASANCSSTHLLSSGGASVASSGTSSGGGNTTSTCSIVASSTTNNSTRNSAQGHSNVHPTPGHLHHQHHHQDRARRSQDKEVILPEPSDVPYSPRAVLVTPPRSDDTGCPVVSLQGDVLKAAPLASSAVVLAELAHREVADGSVFCIISAAGLGTTPAAQPGAGVDITAGAHSVTRAKQQHQQAGGVMSVKVHAAHKEQHQQPEEVPASAASTNTAASSKRSADCGAAVAVGHGQCAAGKNSSSSGGAIVEIPHRRMTMGGGDGSNGGAPVAAQPQRQSSPVSHATALARQHPQVQQPQHSHQQTGSATTQGRHRVAATPGAAATTTAHGIGSSVRSAASDPYPAQSAGAALPPTAAASVAAALHGVSCNPVASQHLAELGFAGHLRVSLTAAHTIAVRELSTPEALAHRVPIRSMAAPALQAEKERLKRQLKDVAAAYEVLAGRALVPALKEPLRPVYVRYHKIKALLSSGRALGSGAQQPAASASVGASGRGSSVGSVSRGTHGSSSIRPSVMA